LLLPVPALAAYTLGVWQVTQPQGFSWSANNSSGFDLSITPQSGLAFGQASTITFTAPVTFTSTSNNITATTNNFNALHNIFSFGGSTPGLTIFIGFENASNNPIATIYQNSNQFVGANPVPSSLAPTQSVTVGSSAAFAVVQFTFSPSVTWQATPSTSI